MKNDGNLSLNLNKKQDQNLFVAISINQKFDKDEELVDKNVIKIKNEVSDLLENSHFKIALADYFEDLNKNVKRFKNAFKKPLQMLEEIESLFLTEMQNLNLTNCYPNENLLGNSVVVMFDSLFYSRNFSCYYKEHSVVVKLNFKVVFNQETKKHELDDFFVDSFLVEKTHIDKDDFFKTI